VRFGPNSILILLALASIDQSAQRLFRILSGGRASIFIGAIATHTAPQSIRPPKFHPSLLVGGQLRDIHRLKKFLRACE
jgi:hypothetical protein